MQEIEGAPAAPTPRSFRPKRRYIALMVAVSIGALAWIERRPIATRVIDARVLPADLPIRYTLTELEPGHQRLENVVIGDPAAPDLVADWIETRTGLGLTGPWLKSLEVGRVKISGRIVDGRLSLGTLDRLIPRGGGGGPVLPSLDLTLARGELRLTTPWGPVLLAAAGQGRLDDGFAGPLALVAPRLSVPGCDLAGVRAALRVTSQGRDRVALTGPTRVGTLACGEARIAALRADIASQLLLGQDRGSTLAARLASGPVQIPGLRADGADGVVQLDHGGGTAFAGPVDLTATGVSAQGVSARRARLDGRLRVTPDGTGFDGRVAVGGADLRARLPRWPVVAGTPVAPLLARLDRALGAAAGDLSGEARVSVKSGPQTMLRIQSAALFASSGARLAVDGRPAVTWRDGAVRNLAATVSAGGGGLPDLSASLTRRGGTIEGSVAVGPYAAGDARLALSPVTVSWRPSGALRLATRVSLDGPIGDGRIEGLAMPLVVTRSADGGFAIDPGCTPVAFRRLAISGLTLDPARLRLCATGSALVASGPGGVSGGARLAATRLTGRLGATPLDVAMRGGLVRLGDRGFALEDVAATLGTGAAATRLAAAQIDGRLADGAVAGRFAGAGGRIGTVPLLLSAAAGDWRFDRGALSLQGRATVADADPTPRFRALDARDIAFTLKGSRIAVAGALYEPTTATRVAAVTIGHDLPSGSGRADIAVPAITFLDGFQPELLTPLTFGVVADVRGTIDGAGRIDWSPAGVTSRGEFGTKGIDLAAAFGPATGIAGRVRFDDLLGLHTPPHQVARVASVNPGIAVENGTVRYQLLGGTQVQVEGAAWPFAGGALTLDPSLLDFDAQRARRLTFHVAGARADQFLQQFDFDNLNATGTFDGTLPMIFDQAGGRIENGSLVVRPGGGTIAYVGALGQEQLGIWGNLAFQALRSLRYRSLALTLNGPLAGEMVTDVRFAGVSQGQGAKSNFLIRRLQRLPFVFNVRIRAPFRGLIDSAASFYDPRRLIQRNLPALLEEQNRRTAPPDQPAPATPIQPPASETVR
ncbi:intermembrane phospholipid transport protein YdbH family protein [Sphingomonas metalli]|uniref:intermembrane phospholipid transport protein YdbH family protein n=1 Tax=Sphingomonas metalli TaxID=1779358 RepID=UPI001E4E7A95|nr:YdbH domain-containing protein [Sphingomonas metalli]